MPILVQYISAEWCTRCHKLKPTVVKYSQVAGAELTVLDYEELEEEEKAKITSLPAIRMKLNTEWITYTSATLTEWVSVITSHAASSSVSEAIDF